MMPVGERPREKRTIYAAVPILRSGGLLELGSDHAPWRLVTPPSGKGEFGQRQRSLLPKHTTGISTHGTREGVREDRHLLSKRASTKVPARPTKLWRWVLITVHIQEVHIRKGWRNEAQHTEHVDAFRPSSPNDQKLYKKLATNHTRSPCTLHSEHRATTVTCVHCPLLGSVNITSHNCGPAPALAVLVGQ